MKICLVSFEYPPSSLILAGAGTYAGFLVEGLKSKGIDVYTITTGKETAYGQNTYRIAIPDITYWRRLFFSEVAAKLLDDLNRIHKFDLVHFNEPHILTKSPDMPSVCTFHSTQLNELKLSLQGRGLKTVKSIRDLIVKNPVGHLCDVVTGNMVDSIICPSSDLVRPLKCCLLNEEKIHVVPNGIDPKKLDEIDCGTASLDKYSIEKENFILYIGRLYALKGVEYLIKAFKSIKQDNPRLKLVVAGSGDYEPYLRRVAQGTDGILFLGYVGSPITKKLLYKNCLTVVVPSIYETFPMVVLEAMAYGRPVVGSDVGGIRSLIRHGKNGFLVRPKNVGELGIFINRLYEDSTLRERMGMFGRSLVEKEFTVDKMTSETMKVYNSLL